MARIVVTGSGGTIGRVLMRDLSHLSPIGIKRSAYDLANPIDFSRMIDETCPDVLIHCAANGGKQGLGEFNKNDLISNLAMVENIHQNSSRIKRIINIGSGAEYGLHNPINTVKEVHLTMGRFGIPRDSYGLSKRLAWQRFETMDNAINLRLFGCFDPLEPEFRLMRKFVNCMKSGEPFTLRQDRKFSWISGTDLSSVIMEIIGRTMSWKWWDRYIPSTMNLAYHGTAGMYLSEILDLWCNLHGMKPTWSISEEEFGPAYTCDSGVMRGYIKTPLKGLEACLKEYE